MKVRMNSSLSGQDVSAAYGQVIDLPDADAGRYVAAGLADAVDEPAPAPKKPPKNAPKKKAASKKETASDKGADDRETR